MLSEETVVGTVYNIICDLQENKSSQKSQCQSWLSYLGCSTTDRKINVSKIRARIPKESHFR